MKKGLKIYITIITTLNLILMVVCTFCAAFFVRTAYSVQGAAHQPAPSYGELTSRLEQAEEDAADCLNKASSLESSFSQKLPVVNTAKVVVVHQEAGNWYCYFPPEEAGRQSVSALPEELISQVDIKVGDKLFVAYDGLSIVGSQSLMIYPSAFLNVFCAEVLGDASKDEFSQAMDFFEAEIKPYL